MIFSSALLLLTLLSSSASALTLRQRRSQGQSLDWNEAAGDFKALVRAVTFGEPVPKHQESPLQMFDPQVGLFILAAESPVMPELTEMPLMPVMPEMKKAKRSRSQSKNSQPANATSMKKSKRAQSSAQSALSHEDLLLLNFLAAQDEPSQRVRADLKRANERYQSIVAERKKNKSNGKSSSKSNGKSSGKKMNSKPKSTVKSSTKSKPNKSSPGFTLDLKGARNKLTISVAFAVIVTALFCVVVQLFRLFTRPAQSRGFEQLNRRSGAVGYERIALDVEEEGEAMPLNA